MRDLSAGHDSHLLASYLCDPFIWYTFSIVGRCQQALSKVSASYTNERQKVSFYSCTK